jgi:hypothetical protein
MRLTRQVDFTVGFSTSCTYALVGLLTLRLATPAAFVVVSEHGLARRAKHRLAIIRHARRAQSASDLYQFQTAVRSTRRLVDLPFRALHAFFPSRPCP